MRDALIFLNITMNSIPKLDHLNTGMANIADAIHRTPLLFSHTISDIVGQPVILKFENLQKTGSFKVRGALNSIVSLDDNTRKRGVITTSAGNHAQAVAWAANRAGTCATVVMPAHASESKIRASKKYGAEVILQDTVFDAFDLSLELAKKNKLNFIHPFDDPITIAGQGTIGIEIIEEIPNVENVIVPIGGGGLISGIALAIANLAPSARVFGVEPYGASAMRQSLDKGRAIHLNAIDTVADGLGAPMAGELNFKIVQNHVEDVVLVSDDEIRQAMRFVLDHTKTLAEPAGAATIAALLKKKIDIKKGPVVAIISGGNVDLEMLPDLFATTQST